VKSRKIKNLLQSILEWLIIGVFLLGGVQLLFYNPVVEMREGFLVDILGSTAALIVYALTFLLEGLLLTFAKWRKKKNLRKNTLFAIYLTLIFTILLEILLVGFGWEAADNIVLTLMAGWCWLHWKMRITYLDPNVFKKDIEQLTKEQDHG